MSVGYDFQLLTVATALRPSRQSVLRLGPNSYLKKAAVHLHVSVVSVRHGEAGAAELPTARIIGSFTATQNRDLWAV